MSTDKTPFGTPNELVWLYRLRQAELFGPHLPQERFSGDRLAHDTLNCADCAEGPCDLAVRELERGFGDVKPRVTPNL